MTADRVVEPAVDPAEIVDVLVEHYERFADRGLRTLAQEERQPALQILIDLGREYRVG
jgi:hypothetical protein